MLYVPLAAMGLFSSKVVDGEWQGGSPEVKSEPGSLTKVSATAKKTYVVKRKVYSSCYKKAKLKQNIKSEMKFG